MASADGTTVLRYIEGGVSDAAESDGAESDVARVLHVQWAKNRRQGGCAGFAAGWSVLALCGDRIVLAAAVGTAHDPIVRVVTVDAMPSVLL